MGTITATSRIEVQLVAGTWTALAAQDVLLPIRCRRGLPGNGPTDVVADRGELNFDLDNSTKNAGGILGWYSPASASARSGWGYGVPVRWMLYYESSMVITITRALQVATATKVAHGLSSNDYVLVQNATQPEYNGVFQITVTGADTFTYTVTGTPATPATGTITATRVYMRFRGKVGQVLPMPGQYQDRRVNVVCYDAMDDLLTSDLRNVTVQLAQTESQLLTTLIAALPTAAQPPATSFPAGVDTFAYCFDKLGDGSKAASAVKDIMQSTLGAVYLSGDGTLVYKTRRERAAEASALTLSNTMISLAVPSSLDNVYNRVRTTCHPKTIDPAATTVLWAQTGTAPAVVAAQTATMWGTYRDPTDTQTLIGATSQVTPIIATTDYTANDQADGLGTDRTASVSVVTTAFASTVKFEVTNNYTGTVYITKLQIRGKGVYDTGPRTFEATSTITNYDRPIDVDMPYQENVDIAVAVGQFINSQYKSLTSQVDSVEFVAGRSTTFMAAAMSLEPTKAVTITETVTGLSASSAVVQSLELAYEHAKSLHVRLMLAPGAPYHMWRLGVAGYSELGTTTVLGF